MVTISLTELIALLSVIVSLFALNRTNKTAVDSRRGIVLKQYCDTIRQKGTLYNIIDKIHDGKSADVSLSEKLEVFMSLKELHLQINSNRIHKDVASILFIRFVDDLLNCKEFWESDNNRTTELLSTERKQIEILHNILKTNFNSTKKVKL